MWDAAVRVTVRIYRRICSHLYRSRNVEIKLIPGRVDVMRLCISLVDNEELGLKTKKKKKKAECQKLGTYTENLTQLFQFITLAFTRYIYLLTLLDLTTIHTEIFFWEILIPLGNFKMRVLKTCYNKILVVLRLNNFN